GRRPRTYVALTGPGKAAFEAHVAALQAILGGKADDS
ncbi:MAG: transcriptional regulator, partial [Caldilineae bacterium]